MQLASEPPVLFWSGSVAAKRNDKYNNEILLSVDRRY